MFKNVGANWVLSLAQVGIIFVLTPFVVGELGDDAYGTWTLIKQITGFLLLMLLGIPMASVKFVTECVAREEPEELNKTVGSCAAIYFAMFVLSLLIGGVMFLFYEATYSIPDDLVETGRWTFALVVIHVAVGFFGQLFYSLMAGHHDFVVRNVIILGGLVIRLVLTLICLSVDASMLWLAKIQLVMLAFELGVSWVVVKRRYPEVRFRPSDIDRRTVKKIFSFSIFVFLMQVAIKLSFMTDAMVIGRFIDVESNTPYSVPNDIIVNLSEFIIGIAAVVMAMSARLVAQGKREELADILLKWSKIALSLVMVAGLYLLVLGPAFIGRWMGPRFIERSGQPLQILMLSCFIFLPARGVALPILLGMGKAKAPTIAFLLAGVLNVGISIVLAPRWGLVGVALGTAIPNALFAVYVLWLVCRELEISLGRLVIYTWGRATVGALAVVAFLVVVERSFVIDDYPSILVSGVASVVLFGAIWVLFVFRNDRYLDLGARLSALRNKLGR